jgi:hypothetical protein
MYTLGDIRRASPAHVCNEPLLRNAAVAAAYERERARTRALYASNTDFVLAHVFGMPTVALAGGRLCAVGSLCAQSLWTVAPNEYPYDVAAGLQHWVVWHNSPERDMETAARMVSRYFQGCDVWWFANALPLMSVPECFHVHVVKGAGPITVRTL